MIRERSSIHRRSSSIYMVFRYLYSFYKLYPWYISFLLFFSSSLGCVGAVNSYLIKMLIDSLVTLTEPDVLTPSITQSAVLLFVNMEVYNISWRALDYICLKLIPSIRNKVVNDAFFHIHNQSQSFFHDSLSGVLAHNIQLLADNTELVTKILFIRFVRGIVQIAVAIITMYFVHPIFAVALISWVFCFVGFSTKLSKKILGFADRYAMVQAAASGHMVDSITNSTNVKLFARKIWECMILSRYLDTGKKKYEDREWFLIKFHYAQGLSITFLIGFMLYGLVQLRLHHQVTVGDFALILGLALYVTEYVWTVTEYIDRMHDATGQCRNALNTIFVPIIIKDAEGAGKLVVKEGSITFDKVRFCYHKTIMPVFQDKSVLISPKQKVGLVGYSGSGKTTFINLLLRLYEVESGKILIDGQDIRIVTQDSLHEAIAVIPQEPFLFHRSLMDNIRYGRLDASEAEVIQAAEQVKIHEFINRLPDGYNTLVGERGIKLSGGQRQKIALARAILKNAPILILDEATSHLDSLTEHALITALDQFMRNKTTIVIAHRLSTLLKMDRILVFDDGKIIEDGTHLELLSQKGLYRKLWDTQREGFIIDE